jgi:hypothetical protein
MMDPRPSVTCGIDWAEGHYDVAVVDADGGLVGKSRFADTSEGFGAFIELLATAGDTENDPIPVAIETPRGLLVSALRATGRQVYSINPMAVARYRERWTVARSKSDHADAMVLANILRTDIHAHRPLPRDSELARTITVLARAHQDATWRRTGASNELRSLLREYYPGFLHAFAARGATNLAGRDARMILAIAPTPHAGASLTKPASPQRCAAADANATSTASRPRSTKPCTNRNCGSHHRWSRRWVSRHWRCWRCSTPPVRASSSLVRRPSRRSSNTPTTT